MWKIEKVIKKGDYDYALVKNHPNSTKNGYVLLHRIIMENSLNRQLINNEIVHHKDGDRHNNNVENLEIMTREKHASLHNLKYPSGGHTIELICANCGKIFIRKYCARQDNKNNKRNFCSRHCNGQFYHSDGHFHKLSL
jgi:hypothetical protein